MNRKGQRIHRFGGPWKAFISDRCRGRKWEKGEMSKLSAEFRMLSEAELDHFREVGQLATIAGQHGHVPFGPQPKPKPQEGPLRLLPGDVTKSGAIVLGDIDMHENEIVARLPRQSFEETYADFVKALRSSQKKSEAALDEDASIHLHVGTAGHAAVKQLVQVSGCSAFQSAFGVDDSQNQGPGHGPPPPKPSVCHLTWKPPLKDIAQARVSDQTGSGGCRGMGLNRFQDIDTACTLHTYSYYLYIIHIALKILWVQSMALDSNRIDSLSP